MSRIKLGILGAGHLGKVHLKVAKELSDIIDVVGFYDPDKATEKEAEATFGLRAFGSVAELITHSDAVDIVTPTLSHFECAIQALRSGKHIFIEKPMAHTLEESRKLIEMVHEAKVVAQVGHVERFNPAFVAASGYFDQVMFVEAHRLAEFNPRGTDVSVVLDLMIHDIDIILSVVKSNLRKVSASGVAVVSETPDICNARLEFDNGCVANITASRISLKKMRKSRFFQKNAYIAVDFLERKTEVVQITDPEADNPFSIIIEPGRGKPPRQLVFSSPEVPNTNAIKEELAAFAHSITNGTKPSVGVEAGHAAMQVAHQILEQLNYTNSIFAH